ncbi:MAG: hypothetical protein EBV45_05950 [Chloroflexi bacterium]|nr:hypothetical protein [Chloroflexota bacterium]
MSVFVDEAQLNVKGGQGGAGCVAFRREGPEAMGGPNGGDGGKGGDVWLVADRNVASLLAFRDHPHRRAKDGVHGKGKDLHGRRGEDLIIAVPEGTVARDMYSGEVLADLVNHGDKWMASPGGRGGRGRPRHPWAPCRTHRRAHPDRRACRRTHDLRRKRLRPRGRHREGPQPVAHDLPARTGRHCHWPLADRTSVAHPADGARSHEWVKRRPVLRLPWLPQRPLRGGSSG